MKLLARQKNNGQKNNEKKKTNEKKNEAAATAPFVKLVRTRKSKSAGKKGKTKKHTSSGSSEQKTLSMKNELYVLRSANTELEKELALTRTLCHELQATTKAREDKLVQLERLVSKKESKKDDNNANNATTLTSRIIGYSTDTAPRLLLHAHRQIERLHKVLHEKQLELHAYAAMSEGGTSLLYMLVVLVVCSSTDR